MANNDYLRYSANSIKDLIRIKLNENGTFTDQNFQDSNMSVFIDTLSYMYSMLIYYLNTSAAESMFVDTQLYENINRLVKMLGYNPQGFVTSTALFDMGIKTHLSAPNPSQIYTIPKYTTYNTSLTDANGNTVSYTFIRDFTFVAATNTTIDSSFNEVEPLYNGRWKLYTTQFLAQGIPYETFTLSDLVLDGDNRVYVAHNKFDIYVQSADGSTYTLYTATNNLYNSLATDNNFEVRVNENYQYTLKFGDDINGRKLEPNSKLYIVYLQSNGPDGQIGAGMMDGTAKLAITIDGLDTELFIKPNILKWSTSYNNYISDPDLEQIALTNPEPSTFVSDFETVNQIKQNAPTSFRIGGRLVTTNDFKNSILMNFSNEVYDVAVMNNWEYMVEFQQWLNLYNKLTPDIVFYDYKYADSCDFNNIYLWLKSYGSSNTTHTVKVDIEQFCDKLKPATAEVIPMDPFIVTFTPYFKGIYDVFDWDVNNENTVQLVRDRNTLITVERIQQRAVSIIQDFFTTANCKIGMTININELYNQLQAIDGVSKVRTAYLKNGDAPGNTVYFEGLNFAMWTNHIMRGEDFQTVNGNIKLRNFQFPTLYDPANIGNRIQIISDSYNVAGIEY
jgi:hypothetical protein